MLSPGSTPPTLKIGIYRSTSIGDVVVATACLDLLRQLSINAQITWIGRSPALQLIQNAYPEIRTVEAGTKSEIAENRNLRRSLSDLHFIVDLQTSIRSRFLCRLMRAEYRIPYYSVRKNTILRGTWVLGSRIRGRIQKLPLRLMKCDRPQYQMMVDCLTQALSKHLPVEALDQMKDLKARPLLLTQYDDQRRPWQKEIKYGKWLAIAPGAAHPAKQTPLDVYLRILTRLRRLPELQQTPVGLVFLGNEKDREFAVQIIDQIAWPYQVINLAGKLSLWESALAAKEAKVVLGNDSSMSHIAEAVGTPVATLFGPTIEAFGFAPWRSESRAFSVALGCRPCSKHGKQDCRYNDQLCFKSLNENEIADFLLKGVLS